MGQETTNTKRRPPDPPRPPGRAAPSLSPASTRGTIPSIRHAAPGPRGALGSFPLLPSASLYLSFFCFLLSTPPSLPIMLSGQTTDGRHGPGTRDNVGQAAPLPAHKRNELMVVCE